VDLKFDMASKYMYFNIGIPIADFVTGNIDHPIDLTRFPKKSKPLPLTKSRKHLKGGKFLPVMRRTILLLHQIIHGKIVRKLL
jgi:hypothetical protein